MLRLDDFNFASMGLRCFFHHTQAVLQPNFRLVPRNDIGFVFPVSRLVTNEGGMGQGPARACAHDVREEGVRRVA